MNTGPPHEHYVGFALVILKMDEFAPTNPPPWDHYSGHPVVVRWWGSKGKTTFGEFRIDPGQVERWMPMETPG